MRDVEVRHVIALLEFMYAGEVNVAQAQLAGFLRTAESLQIRGLTDASKYHKDNDVCIPYSIIINNRNFVIRYSVQYLACKVMVLFMHPILINPLLR